MWSTAKWDHDGILNVCIVPWSFNRKILSMSIWGTANKSSHNIFKCLKNVVTHRNILLCTIVHNLNLWFINIFLPVFKSLKFSLQYEILNLEVFLQINGANYAFVVANANFHFQISFNQFWIPVKATCFFMVQNHWYVQ